MVTLQMSNIFAESANRLPKQTKAKLPKVFALLTTNPRHPSLHLKKIKGAVRSNIYECRLDQSWRLILREIGGIYDLVYVGAHDEAINYGVRLRERGVPYDSHVPIMERLESFIAGDDKALEFVLMTPEYFQDNSE